MHFSIYLPFSLTPAENAAHPVLHKPFSEGDSEIKHAKCHYFPLLKCIYIMWTIFFLLFILGALLSTIGFPRLQIVSPQNMAYLLLWWDIVESANDRKKQISNYNTVLNTVTHNGESLNAYQFWGAVVINLYKTLIDWNVYCSR